jgi:hypothetical protein
MCGAELQCLPWAPKETYWKGALGRDAAPRPRAAIFKIRAYFFFSGLTAASLIACVSFLPPSFFVAIALLLWLNLSRYAARTRFRPYRFFCSVLTGSNFVAFWSFFAIVFSFMRTAVGPQLQVVRPGT